MEAGRRSGGAWEGWGRSLGIVRAAEHEDSLSRSRSPCRMAAMWPFYSVVRLQAKMANLEHVVRLNFEA